MNHSNFIKGTKLRIILTTTLTGVSITPYTKYIIYINNITYIKCITHIDKLERSIDFSHISNTVLHKLPLILLIIHNGKNKFSQINFAISI